MIGTTVRWAVRYPLVEPQEAKPAGSTSSTLSDTLLRSYSHSFLSLLGAFRGLAFPPSLPGISASRREGAKRGKVRSEEASASRQRGTEGIAGSQGACIHANIQNRLVAERTAEVAEVPLALLEDPRPTGEMRNERALHHPIPWPSHDQGYRAPLHTFYCEEQRMNTRLSFFEKNKIDQHWMILFSLQNLFTEALFSV